MSSLRLSEKASLEKLLRMEAGYVLNLSDVKFNELFSDLFGLDITTAAYRSVGTSKANRLRAFWKLHSDQEVALILDELVKFGIAHNLITEDLVAYQSYLSIAKRLSGGSMPAPSPTDTSAI